MNLFIVRYIFYISHFCLHLHIDIFFFTFVSQCERYIDAPLKQLLKKELMESGVETMPG